MDNQRANRNGLPTSHAGGQWDMWDRRTFMAAAGVAIGASAGLTAPIGIAAAVPSRPGYFRMIVADTRFPEVRTFAAEAARAGNRIVWITGDITDLWYKELDLLWRKTKAPIAGLTGYGAFFCLERLAWDRGLRVAFKEEHRRIEAAQQASLYSWAIAPKPSHRIAGGAA